MASMGMLGAISGGAQGFNEALKLQIEEARETRLAKLRGEESRTTNKESNAQQHSDRMAEADKRQEYSLSNMQAEDAMTRARMMTEDEMARARQSDQHARELSERESFENVLDKDGNVIGQRSKQTGKESRFPTSQTDQETFTWKPDESTDEYGNSTVRGYQGLGNRGSKGEYIPAGAQAPASTDTSQDESYIQKIMEANKGKDRDWAQQYLEHLRSTGKI